jgi:hypothetical protein
LRRAMNLTFTVFPKTAVFSQPPKGPFNHPPWRSFPRCIPRRTELSPLPTGLAHNSAVSHVRTRYPNRVRQAVGINAGVNLYPRSFLPASYPFPPAAPVFFTLLESMITLAVFASLPRITRSDNTGSRNIRSNRETSPIPTAIFLMRLRLSGH